MLCHNLRPKSKASLASALAARTLALEVWGDNCRSPRPLNTCKLRRQDDGRASNLESAFVPVAELASSQRRPHVGVHTDTMKQISTFILLCAAAAPLLAADM